MEEQQGTFVLMGPRCWAKGAGIDEAKKEYRKQGGKLTEKIYLVAFSPTASFSHIDNFMRVHYDGPAPAVSLFSKGRG